ncbi:dihydrodipicolinate synthase [Megasphaera cerevisiae DSM 20462]|jgi:4-hydroxy-tetrahydrodipicolinate synthase|uniref:4-hydroxy-tetrahydrodipicolinate synthase n=1 Tax=Megasphaera cerevisiae DSM 20462 TaxID=1122219 RepID=A0A0J6WVQ5_9FIRM|nr:4-hydroxy-tetrahydrodipicolinate synthase [Megasphaera cerevisiae]KMO86649.1 dihydrodipicolinate synthase [Megasphaera cerevisiae DSM 20462]MCI1750453.1 4-hydroxy-tetrahydrodipicolinate synthase [Megasphaera cerevisiae]OKY52717.1 4-hydroxy-tetrahydrodipicolinate synthase [Megasphaera cerevisiae]SJZ88407.1 4-hydroxy-tetrahydrodipicolinate synthase [Megasphaera cerevisiae DSM 20462]
MLKFGNVITAMITPFHENGSVNYKEAANLAKYYSENGSDGILVAGTTGEGATLTVDEKLKLFKDISQAIGDKVLVMANVGSNDTAQTIDFAKQAEQTGVDCLLVIVPYYNKPNQSGCYAHFAAVAQATKLPIIIYNVPGRTGGKILAETVVKLARDFDNIIGIKEASGDLEAAASIARDTPSHFYVYSGDDALTLPILSVGGRGIISVAAHIIGNQMNEMVQAYKDGNVKKAMELHHKYLPVMTGIFCTVNPTPIKACCNILGMPAGPFRLPMVDASDKEKEFLQTMMRDAGIMS